MQISKWGNSLAVRLPAKLVEQLDLKEGDEIELRPSSTEGVFEVVRQPDRLDVLHELRKFRGLMPADFKFDREEANKRWPRDED